MKYLSLLSLLLFGFHHSVMSVNKTIKQVIILRLKAHQEDDPKPPFGSKGVESQIKPIVNCQSKQKK